MKKTSKTKLVLEVQKREIFGKKLKALRKTGVLPGNIFGESMESKAVMLPLIELKHTFKKAGETQIVYLKIDGEELPVLIQNLQFHPMTAYPLHVDFRKVNLKKKIETEVPIKLVGESEAVNQNKGILLNMAESVLVEALPEDIPQEIEIDLSVLKELDDQVAIKDLKVTGEFILKDDPEKVIVRITEHKEESIETQVVSPDTVEVTTEKKDDEAIDEKVIENTPEEK
jgi:large subunit ribosomal protein L25